MPEDGKRRAETTEKNSIAIVFSQKKQCMYTGFILPPYSILLNLATHLITVIQYLLGQTRKIFMHNYWYEI